MLISNLRRMCVWCLEPPQLRSWTVLNEAIPSGKIWSNPDSRSLLLNLWILCPAACWPPSFPWPLCRVRRWKDLDRQRPHLICCCVRTWWPQGHVIALIRWSWSMWVLNHFVLFFGFNGSQQSVLCLLSNLSTQGSGIFRMLNDVQNMLSGKWSDRGGLFSWLKQPLFLSDSFHSCPRWILSWIPTANAIYCRFGNLWVTTVQDVSPDDEF